MKGQLFDLTGRVAIVTGGNQWLGNDVANIFAEYGCNVIITSRTVGKLEGMIKDMKEKYPESDFLALQLDQNDPDSIQRMADDAFNWKGRIDILYNNAGGGSGKSEGNLFQRSPEAIRDMINTNLTGCLLCCRAVGAYMVKQGHGKIINTGSIAGIVGRDRSMYYDSGVKEQPIDYAAAKSGVIGMTRDLAGLMSPLGVNVNSISPGGFDKGELPEAFVSRYSSETMLGHMGVMGQDIKGAALFLASDASNYVTGHNLVVDGGFSVWK